MPRIYRCTQTIIMDDGQTEAFTAGRIYHGLTSATPGGEWAMSFTNNQGEAHLIGANWLHQYFSPITEGRNDLVHFADEWIEQS